MDLCKCVCGDMVGASGKELLVFPCTDGSEKSSVEYSLDNECFRVAYTWSFFHEAVSNKGVQHL